MLLGHGSLLRGADVLPTALAALEEWCTASERLDGVNGRQSCQGQDLLAVTTRVRGFSASLCSSLLWLVVLLCSCNIVVCCVELSKVKQSTLL